MAMKKSARLNHHRPSKEHKSLHLLVVCDDLSAHKVSGVAEAIAARGAHLQCLPASSPDLNPIEPAFSKLKALLRSTAARDLPSLVTAAAEALDAFSSAECLNFFRHAQYATD
jgi:transposase